MRPRPLVVNASLRGTALLRGGSMLVIALSAIACGKDGLVGGSCRKGLTECGLRCVDVDQDPSNCGVCGHACAAGQACGGGTCGSSEAAVDVAEDGESNDVAADISPDIVVDDRASMSDGRIDSAADGISMDGVTSDGAPSDISSTDSTVDDGSSGDGATCTPPYDSPDHCGDCTTKCVDPTPLCGLQGTFKCVARCDPPLIACGAICINPFSDEQNCGGCSVVCPSGICQAGGCVGKGYGHEIVIGMDYADPTLSDSSGQVTMLGNAIFQGPSPTVRVLAYDEFAESATVTRINNWLSTAATARGKTIVTTKASGWAGVPQQLTVQQYQVFLVYDQALAPADQMATNGTLWNDAMNAFAKGGGIVVALDGGSVGRMRDLISNGGLLPISAETDVTGTQLNVDAPTDVVGQGLPNVLAAKKSSVAFTTTQVRDNYHVFVVTDPTGVLPVVVHSVPKP